MPTSESKAFFRECPACGGDVHTVASKCKHCGAGMRAAVAAPARAHDSVPPSAHRAEPMLASSPAPAPVRPPVPAPTPARLAPASTDGRAPTPAAAAPRALADSSGRWLLFGGAALLLAIGMALGVIIERTDRTQPTVPAAVASRTYTAQRPLMPDVSPPDDFDFGFDLDSGPNGPGFGLRIQPFARRPRGAHGSEPTVAELARQLGDELCTKLADCADVDPAIAMLCRTVAGQLDASELAEQIARGECSYDADAAGRCIDGFASLDCRADQQDPLTLMRTVEAVMACTEAIRCDAW